MTEAEKRKARLRRREEDRRRLRSRLRFDDLPDILDPPSYLEEKRGRLVKMLEGIADETDDPVLKARVCLELLKLSSMGRTRLDLRSAPWEGMLPDLSHLSAEELERLASGGQAAALQGGQDEQPS